MSEQPKCELCGEPMPPGEEMFKFHGYSGPCPKPTSAFAKAADIEAAMPITAGQQAPLGEPNPEYEKKAAALRATSRASEDGRPDGTIEGLAQCARMLNTYAPDCFPANEHGQVHFVRAMMEGTADEIDACLPRLRKCEAAIRSAILKLADYPHWLEAKGAKVLSDTIAEELGKLREAIQ